MVRCCTFLLVAAGSSEGTVCQSQLCVFCIGQRNVSVRLPRRPADLRGNNISALPSENAGEKGGCFQESPRRPVGGVVTVWLMLTPPVKPACSRAVLCIEASVSQTLFFFTFFTLSYPNMHFVFAFSVVFTLFCTFRMSLKSYHCVPNWGLWVTRHRGLLSGLGRAINLLLCPVAQFL